MFDLALYSRKNEARPLWRGIDLLFDEPFFRRREDWLSPWFLPSWSGRLRSLAGIFESFPGDNLAIDFFERRGEFVLQADLAGMEIKDIEVTVQEGFLTIQAKRERKEERQEGGWIVRAAGFGCWRRSLRLPDGVDANRAKAIYENGVLTVTLPKERTHRQIAAKIKVKLPKVRLPRLLNKQKKIRVRHG